MEIDENFHEGIVEPSYKTARVYDKHYVYIRQTYSNMGDCCGKRKKRYIDRLK